MTKLATAATLERITKYIEEYWFSQYTLKDNQDGTWSIIGPNGLKPKHNVVRYRGGYMFQSL
jgi:hypothetical protein